MFSAAQQDMTFLSMVRTDQTQITSILDSTFNEAYAKECPPTLIDLRNAFSAYFDQCKQFLFGQINHHLAVEELKKSSASGKGVCAKTLSHGNVAWKCETCEKDPTCIICQECFELGNHKGHKVWLKRNVSGCCDCGDPDAWQEEGFCSKHKGYSASSEVLLEMLPPYIKKSASLVFRHVSLQLKVQCMQLQVAHHKDQAYRGVMNPESKKAIFKKSYLIHLLFEFIDWVVDVSPAFIHFLTDCLNEVFLNEVKHQKESVGLTVTGDENLLHECCPKAYISSDQRRAFADQLQSLLIEDDGLESPFLNLAQTSSDGEQFSTFNEDILKEIRLAKGICTCNVMDLTFQVNHMLTDQCRNLQYELYFKMFQSFKLKQIIGITFAANFEAISVEREAKKHNIGSIGVQVLTIDDISLMILQDDNLRNNMIAVYTKVMDDLVESDFSEKHQNTLLHILYDIKYMTRAKSLKYSIEQTSFLECLLSQLPKLYYIDRFEHRTEHIMFDNSIFKQGLYETDMLLTKIFKAYLKAVDPTDIPRNKRLMSAFISFFEEIASKMPCDGNEGFFAIPLHRVFSYYFNRLIIQNYFREKSTRPPKEAFMEIFRRYVDIPTGQNAWKYLQNVAEIIIIPLARAWAFTHEILSGKWVMSGMYIGHLPTLLYQIFEYYLLLNIGLFQILVAVSPEPSKIVDSIIGAFSSDAWMRVLHDKLLHQGIQEDVSAKDFEKHKPLFDEKKLRQMVHWELRLLIQISVTEIGFIYPLLTNLSRKEQLTFPMKEACIESIEALFRNDMRRSIIHALVLSGGKADIKSLKTHLAGQELYLSSEHFEDELLQVSTQHREGQAGKVFFKLKEDPFLAYFEPYYYLLPESQAKASEVLQGVFADKKLINEILGDYQAHYTYKTPMNQLIQQGLAQSASLLKFVSSMINMWADQQSAVKPFKVVDDQIAFECLKLLYMIAKHHTTTPSSSIQDFVAIVKDSDWRLFNSLTSIQQHYIKQSGPGSAMEKAVRELLTTIHLVQPSQFKLIGSILGLANEQESSLLDMSQEEEGKLERSKSMADEKKEATRRKQDDIIKKYQAKRQDYMKSQQSQRSESSTPMLSRASSFRVDSTTGDEENQDEIECSLCKETLVIDQFYGHPFGQFAYVSQSKLLYHAYRQALEQDSEGDLGQEKERKESEIETVSKTKNPIEELDINCLDFVSGTGGTLIKCSHYAHYKCLVSYLTANEQDARKRDIRKIIGLNFETFQCPLCKHISNVLLPCDTLNNYHEHKLYQQDFQPYELLEFHTRLISKILTAQEGKKKETLPIDIRKEPGMVLRGMQRFIEHRLQLVDVKGVDEFLKQHHTGGARMQHSHNRVGKEQYADILEMTRNVLSLVLDGGITVQNANVSDTDMTEETLESICVSEIKNILESRKGWRLLECDFSSVALQLMFYSTMISGFGSIKQLDQCIDAIANSVYQMFQLQVLIKALYSRQQMQHGGEPIGKKVLQGKPYELLNLISNRESLLTMGGQCRSEQDISDTQFIDQFVTPEKLTFLRKLAAFKILAHTVNIRTARSRGVLGSQMPIEAGALIEVQKQRKRDEEFVIKLTSQYDDNEEFQILSEYFSLGKSQTSATESESETIPLPEELQEVLTFFSSEEQQMKSLESYALSQLILILNPKLVLDEKEKPIFKDQILATETKEDEQVISMAMPQAFKILSGLRFKLQELPGDFQSLVQTYYKRICKNCGKQPKESCVCLLCGDIVCFVQKCCTGCIPGMKMNEGELSFHSRTCEGGSSMFLCTTNGKVILLEEERSSQRQSPYINKFGETFSASSKRWDNFSLQTGPGAVNFYEEYKRMYMNFSLPNEVIKDRCMTDVIWRLRAI